MNHGAPVRRGHVTSFAHDRLWRLTTLTQADPDGAGSLTSPVSSFVYDVASQLTSQTDPLSRVTSFGYDGLGRQTSVTQPDPDGAGPLAAPVTSYAYDAASNLTSVTDPLSHATTYAYDALNRRTSITDAASGVTSFAFDALGNLKSLTDPSSNVTTWGYDNLNRAVSETNQLNFTRTFAYNAAGDLTSKVDRNGRKTTYEYDALHRQTAEKWRDGSDNVIRTLSSTFNNSLDLTGVSDPAAAYTYVYDNLGRVTQQTQEIAGLTPDIILAQQFDSASNRTRLTATIGENLDFVNDYVYDNLNRLTRVTQDAQPGGEMGMPPYANVVAPKRVDFSYFADGQFNTISRYQSTGTSNAVAQSYHTYDGIGRLTDLDHKQSTTVLAGYDYVYDAASRITSINSTVEGLSTFTYDVTNQLTGADHASPRADESYTYDSNGNRTMTGYTTGTNNQTTSDGTYNYEYDNEGNMVKKTTISGGAYEEYTWDYRNRLTTITFKNSSHTVLKTVDNTYDAFNRWVRRTYDSDGPGAAAATDQFFAYDGYNAVLEFAGPSDTDLKHRYLWGPAVDQILADENVTSLSSAGNILWGLSDHLGTPRDIADLNEGSGVTTITNHRTYDSFGVRTAETNSAVDLLFGFTGKALDEITGLQNNVNRLYAAWLGQFPSEDPSTFDGQDPNLRRYVSNVPIRYLDPLGLSIWGKAGKELVEKLIKEGIKRKWFKIHHIVGREIFKDPKIGKWLSRIGVVQDCADNLIALPSKLGKKNGFLVDAALHSGRHLDDYVKEVEKRVADIMKRNLSRGKDAITDAEAKKAIKALQDELREGLESGTIVLQQAEKDALKKGMVISIAGLILLVNEDTAQAAIEHARREKGWRLVTSCTDYARGSGYLGEESWIGWTLDLFNPFDDAKAMMELMDFLEFDQVDTGEYNGIGPIQ